MDYIQQISYDSLKDICLAITGIVGPALIVAVALYGRDKKPEESGRPQSDGQLENSVKK